MNALMTKAALTIGDLLIGYSDSYGEIVYDSIQGWHSGAASRVELEKRVASDGAHEPAKASRESRVITITGWISGSTRRQASDLMHRLRALFSDGQSQTMTVDDPDYGSLSALVHQTGGTEPEIDWDGDTFATWKLFVTAADPRLYGPERIAAMPLPGRGDAPGLVDWPSSPAGPTLRTNVATNPTVRNSLDGWLSFRSTLARDTTLGDGAVVRATSDGSNATETAAIWAAAAPFAAAGETWAVSFDVRATSTQIEGWRVYFRDGATGTLTTSGSATAFPLDGNWHRVGFAATLAHQADRVYLLGRSPSGLITSGTSIWFDRLLVEKASIAGSYFDGDTPDTSATEYLWTGTPHASLSTTRAPAVAGGLREPLTDGWDPSMSGELLLPNPGTAAFWPRLRIVGPVVNPRIWSPDTGAELRLRLTVPAGQFVDVLCKDRRVLAQGVASRRYAVSYTGDWLAIPPGGASLRWEADLFDPDARLFAWAPEGAYL